MGRPKIVLDYNMIERLAGIMATQEEIAAFLDVSVKTLQRDEEFSRIYKKGVEKGKMSLRRSQMKLAERNAAMAIWLGKQYLGQREVVEQIYTDSEAARTAREVIKLLKGREFEDNE